MFGFGNIGRRKPDPAAMNAAMLSLFPMPFAGVVGSGSTEIIGLLTKAEARAALDELGVTGAQLAGARSAIGRKTSRETLDLIIDNAGNVIVRLRRAGFEGYQSINSTIDASGVKTVIQEAYDALGRLVHCHPK